MGRTVRHLTPEELEAYRHSLSELLAAKQANREQLAEQALEVARQAAALLRQEFGVRRVWLFGSLVRGTFDETSDIDLAVDAIEESRYLRALGRLLSTFPEFEFDLVDLREARPALRSAIEREGQPL